MVVAVDIEKLVGEMELAVDRLRSLYEQYFMGIEKLEPTVPRKDLDRRIQILRKEQIRNTAQRFRFQMILQRYNTYQTHWQRICREIENGTYKRHVMRAQQRFASLPPPAPRRDSAPPPPPPHVLARDLAGELAELDREFAPAGEVDGKDIELEEIAAPPPAMTAPPPPGQSRPGPVWRKASIAPPLPSRAPGARSAPAPPAPGAASLVPAAMRAASTAPAPPLPPPRAAGELPDDRVRKLYEQYVEARRRQNESTAAITYDAVARSLRDSSARLREKHGKAVDFEVTVKDGKAVLRPVLK